MPNVQQPNVPLQQQVPLQPWSSIYYTDYPGTSNFNQLQLEVQKRFANGLMFRTEYDWRSNLTNVNGDNYLNNQDPWDLRADYSNEQFQYRHKFLTLLPLRVAGGPGPKMARQHEQVRGWRSWAAGAFPASPRTTAGDPLPPSFENPGTEIGWHGEHGRTACPVRFMQGVQRAMTPWTVSNGSARRPIAPPQPWHYGNASPDSIFGPGFGDWDVSVMKSFRLPEGEANQLEFKMDFFNLPNHYNLGDPNTGIADVRDGGPPDSTSGKIYGGAGGYAPR